VELGHYILQVEMAQMAKAINLATFDE